MKKQKKEKERLLLGEKRESKLKIWFDDTYVGMWLMIQRLKFKNW